MLYVRMYRRCFTELLGPWGAANHVNNREADPPDLSHGVMDLPAPGVVWWFQGIESHAPRGHPRPGVRY